VRRRLLASDIAKERRELHDLLSDVKGKKKK
jgi:hypothetical protein